MVLSSRSFHKEEGVPLHRAFSREDVVWACLCAYTTSPNVEKEAEFMIWLADKRGDALEFMAQDCRMTKTGYKYLRRECGENRIALKGVERMKEFRESVTAIILKEAYNRKRNTAKKN
jgi:hypothetical protein